ncbi:MAG: DEAD/DEAH box helicase family protein [Balneolaceae bacterium]
MPSNKETLFQDHICSFLENEHDYHVLEKHELPDNAEHIIEDHLIEFIQSTQPNTFSKLKEDYGADAANEILTALKNELEKTPLWLLMRNGITVRGVHFKLYKPYPRTGTESQFGAYHKNKFSFKKEYYFSPLSTHRIDLVIWLNGLPIIVIEIKHEDEGQNVEDAIHESFLKRDLENPSYTLPFLFVALSNTEAKVATNLRSHNSFLWFNAALVNKAETEGEYPVEHVYRHALSKQNIAKYVEHYLLFVPQEEEQTASGVKVVKDSFTIFPRYHQIRASKKIADLVGAHFEEKRQLGKKYLINHSAGSGKTLTIAWMSDLLDSLYTSDGEKAFDNIIILTDRKALDKNVRDDLELFSHLGETKINIAEKSKDLARHLDNNRDIVVSTIHKFSYIQDELKKSDELKNRKVAFLIDEAHRSQDGKLALAMLDQFTNTNDEDEEGDLKKLDISNQVYVAFTATTTAKTVSFFGNPIDTYSEEEAIAEGYILDVAQSIISYKTLYHLRPTAILPEKTFPEGVLAQALQRIAFEDESIIQYKSEVIIQLFEEEVKDAIEGKGKAMVVANSRKAGLLYYQTIKAILEERDADYDVLYAFSDFTDEETGEFIEEEKLNKLDTKHKGKVIEDVFDTDTYRILVVANKFQTGFDQPLLSAMFLDKPVKGANAVQTVSRLNRNHADKEQTDILVVDFTNSADDIFDAFNKHRKGSPYKEREPDKELLNTVYADIKAYGIFDADEISSYVDQYLEAEREARKRNSEADALLSNVNQQYREKFRKALPDIEAQKVFVSLLSRYTKLYYFIAKFFELEEKLHRFVVFAEAMKMVLLNRGKISELKQYLKDVELEKGALTNKQEKVNEPAGIPQRPGGLRNGNPTVPTRSTIEEMLDSIREKYQINDKEAIIIKDICEKLSKRYDVVNSIEENIHSELYLKTRAARKVKREIKNEYISREMFKILENPLYNGRGGIFSLMSNTVINNVKMRMVG